MGETANIARVLLGRGIKFLASMTEGNRLLYGFPAIGDRFAHEQSYLRDIAAVASICSYHRHHYVPHDLVEDLHSLCLTTLTSYSNSLGQYTHLRGTPYNIGTAGYFLKAFVEYEMAFGPLDAAIDSVKFTTIELIQAQYSNGCIPTKFQLVQPQSVPGEEFLLPEAVLGLMSCLSHNRTGLQNLGLENCISHALAYIHHRDWQMEHLISDPTVYYANWQLQLLVEWSSLRPHRITEVHLYILEDILDKLEDKSQAARLDTETIELAYLAEALSYARRLVVQLPVYHQKSDQDWSWIESRLEMVFTFLNTIQESSPIPGGLPFNHHGDSGRIDITCRALNAASNFLEDTNK